MAHKSQVVLVRRKITKIAFCSNYLFQKYYPLHTKIPFPEQITHFKKSIFTKKMPFSVMLWRCLLTWGRLERNLQVPRSTQDPWGLSPQHQRNSLLFLLRSSKSVCETGFVENYGLMPCLLKSNALRNMFWGVVRTPYCLMLIGQVQRRNLS